MGDKGEGGVKNLKKNDDIIYGWPKWYITPYQYVLKNSKWSVHENRRKHIPYLFSFKYFTTHSHFHNQTLPMGVG